MSAPAGSTLVDDVREATLQSLWRQWHAIGATTSSAGHAQSIVDVDVLVLMSLWMLEQEHRLADVVTSWVKLNSSLLSIQRLGNLRDEFPESTRPALSALAVFGMEEAKDSRWKSLVDKKRSKLLGERSNKARAIGARITSWAALQLRMRRGMGVGAKADTLTFLLGTSPQTEWASVATIAEAIGYTPAAVRRVADDLAQAEFVRSPHIREGDRLQRIYSADRTGWGTLLKLNLHDPGWGYWRERYRFLIDYFTSAQERDGRVVSDYARDVLARELLTKHADAFRRDRVVDPAEFASAELNHQFLEDAVRKLVNWMGHRG